MILISSELVFSDIRELSCVDWSKRNSHICVFTSVDPNTYTNAPIFQSNLQLSHSIRISDCPRIPNKPSRMRWKCSCKNQESICLTNYQEQNLHNRNMSLWQWKICCKQSHSYMNAHLFARMLYMSIMLCAILSAYYTVINLLYHICLHKYAESNNFEPPNFVCFRF